MKRRYGWLHELPDIRDISYKGQTVVLPKSVDLTANCSPVENQGSLGSCTANALVGILEYNEPKDSAFVDLSRLFIYYNERALEGNVNYDSGAMIRDGIKTLAKCGVCDEKIWPYIISKFREKPNKKCYQDAKKRKIISYATMDTLLEMKQCLADGFPFAFGFTVYESFESQEVADTGIATLPEPGERPIGGHAVVGVGYDDDKQMIKVRNSWGKDWGQKGYFYLPYEYIGNKNLADDMWQILK